MIVIGVDPHKTTHTAVAVDPVTNTGLGSLRIDATLAGYRRMLVWAKQWAQQQWAVENAEGLGHHLAQWLLARGEVVLDVPATFSPCSSVVAGRTPASLLSHRSLGGRPGLKLRFPATLSAVAAPRLQRRLRHTLLSTDTRMHAQPVELVCRDQGRRRQCRGIARESGHAATG